MVEHDDLRLNEPSEPGPSIQEPPTGPSLLIPGIVIAAIPAIGGAIFFWPKAAVPAREPQPTAPAPVSSSARPQAEPGENIPLPPLDETDPLVRQLVSRLSTHPRVTAWLATDGLLRNFAVVVANIAEGARPIKQLATQRPAARFAVRETAAGAFIDPESYRRYDAYADGVAGLDARGTARVYATLKPRIAEAYRDVGYPDADIDSALTRAFIVLLRTPRVGENVAVKRRSINWQYADPALESLLS
jgi:hypothetical protein